MWYFTWILGVLLALAFGVINVMWYEAEQCFDLEENFLKKAAEPKVETRPPNVFVKVLKKLYLID